MRPTRMRQLTSRGISILALSNRTDIRSSRILVAPCMSAFMSHTIAFRGVVIFFRTFVANSEAIH